MKNTSKLSVCSKSILSTTLCLLLSISYCFSQSVNIETVLQPNEDTTSKFSLSNFPVVKVTYADEYRGYGTGSGSVTAKKGYKFLGVYVTVSNPGKAPININLTDILLLDMANKIKYKVHAVMGTGPFTVFKKDGYSLKPGKDVSRKLVYIIPKDFNAEMLYYGQSLLPIGEIHK